MKNFIIDIIGVCVTVVALSVPRLSAQTLVYDPRQDMAELGNSWLETANPTSIGIYEMPDMGSVRLTGGHLSGNLHRAMESDKEYGWGFGADHYKSLEHLNLWGDFTFRNTRHTGRRWSDNIDPYNGNPYQAGSEISGNYVAQNFDFGLKISSKRLFNRIWLGLGFDYSLEDFSRINDPRSRVQAADLELRPGLTVQLADSHLLGLDFTGRYRKEKNNRYVIQSADANDFMIWRQEGLGVYSTILSNRFERRVKGSWIGGCLQYEGRWDNLSILTEARYGWRKDIIEDMLKESPGDYGSHDVLLKLVSRWNNSKSMQTAHMYVGGKMGTSLKNFQQMVTETEEDTGMSNSWYETIFSAKSYTHDEISVLIDWQYIRKDGQDYIWYIHPSLNYIAQQDRYCFYRPASELAASSLNLTFEGGIRLLSKKEHRLYLGLGTGFLCGLGGHIFASPELEDQEMIGKIYGHDYSILGTSYAHICLQMNWVFPLSRKINGFITLEDRGNFSISPSGRYRNSANLALGILQNF